MFMYLDEYQTNFDFSAKKDLVTKYPHPLDHKVLEFTCIIIQFEYLFW